LCGLAGGSRPSSLLAQALWHGASFCIAGAAGLRRMPSVLAGTHFTFIAYRYFMVTGRVVHSGVCSSGM